MFRSSYLDAASLVEFISCLICVCVSLFLWVVWKRGSAAGVGEARERASRTREAQEAQAAGAGRPGASHRPQQGRDVQRMTWNPDHISLNTHKLT